MEDFIVTDLNHNSEAFIDRLKLYIDAMESNDLKHAFIQEENKIPNISEYRRLLSKIDELNKTNQ